MPEKKDDHYRFYNLMEKLFKEIDQKAIRAEVAGLRKAKPDLAREQIAEQMTKKAAVRVASVGAAAGVAGGPLGVLAMAPDIFNLVLQQSRLVLSIAFLYDQQPDLKERFREVLATLAVATGASASRQGIRLLLTKGLERAAAGQLARKIFGRFLVRRIPAIAPVLGTVAGGTINYLSMRAVGRAAVSFYAAKDLEAASRNSKPIMKATPRKARTRKPVAKKTGAKKSAAKKSAAKKSAGTKSAAPRKHGSTSGSLESEGES